MSQLKTRIYAVHDAALDKCHLVRATSGAVAVRFVARLQYTAEVATQERLVEALSAGASVLDAANDVEKPEPEAEGDQE
ncbi:MAG: hypothetical protein JST65_16155 [Acidobacteria bacterium]|nr:hypothetical protein [Acidobacteriota bacterium]